MDNQIAQPVKNSLNTKDEDDDDEEDDDYIPSDADSEYKGDSSDDEKSEDNPSGDEAHLNRKIGRQKSKKQRNKEHKKEESGSELSSDEEAKLGKQKFNETYLKKKSDDLWADLLSSAKKPVSESLTQATNNSNQTKLKHCKEVVEEIKCPIKDEKIIITKIFDFAGEEVKVNEEVDVNSEEAKKIIESTSKESKVNDMNCSSTSILSTTTIGSTAIGNAKRSGIGNLLSNLNKKPKLSTLTKTQLDWKSFKQTEGLNEELQQHVKSKDGFVERQAFLLRSDLRQFELEKQIRDRNRVSKN